MMTITTDSNFALLRQGYGNFDRRRTIGPANWPHHDLLWIHEGGVDMTLGTARSRVTLQAPGGILILPNTPFSGTIRTERALASITHFRTSTDHLDREDGYFSPAPKLTFALQTMIGLSQLYCQQTVSDSCRKRLLIAIVDAFNYIEADETFGGRSAVAWEAAAQNLASIRTLADVAALVGLSESAFRAMHRRETGTSAGKHLATLRFSTAEHLLATSTMSIKGIAKSVGYGSAESFSRAFRHRYMMCPSEFRITQGPFA